MLNESDKVKLIEAILTQAISEIDQKTNNAVNIDELIQLAKVNKSWEKLCELIIRDSIEIINSKAGRLINIFDQSEKFIGLQSFRQLPKNILNEKYKKILDELKFEYDKLPPNFQFNIKILRQLENLEEVLNVLEAKGVSKALEVLFLLIITFYFFDCLLLNFYLEIFENCEFNPL